MGCKKSDRLRVWLYNIKVSRRQVSVSWSPSAFEVISYKEFVGDAGCCNQHFAMTLMKNLKELEDSEKEQAAASADMSDSGEPCGSSDDDASSGAIRSESDWMLDMATLGSPAKRFVTHLLRVKQLNGTI